MNILIVNTFYTPNDIGGAENSCKVIAESLVDNGHTVSVVSTTNKPSYQDKLNGVKLYYIKLFNIFWHGHNKKQGMLRGVLWHLLDFFNPIMAYRFYRIIKLVKPDVVHTNNIVGFSCSIWLVCKCSGVPIVHTLRDYYLKCYRSSMRKNSSTCVGQCGACKLLTSSRKLLSSTVSICVGNSQFMIDAHYGSGYFTKTTSKTVIFNGWSPKFDYQTHHLTKNYNKQVNDYVFGFIGRLSEEKGIELLCDAFLKFIKQEFSNASSQPTLIIAGEGAVSYVDKLKVDYNHPTISFIGKVTPESFYPSIDFVVVPSLWEEPLARVVFEAFFCSVPVLSSNKGGNPEVINDGLNGFIFEPSVDKLILCLSKAIYSDYSSLCSRAYESRNSFKITRLISEYTNTYQNALLSCTRNQVSSRH